MTHKMIPFPTKIFIKDQRSEEELPACGGKIFNTFLKIPTKDYDNFLKMKGEDSGSGIYGSGFLDFVKKIPIVGNLLNMFTGNNIYDMETGEGAFDWKDPTSEIEKLEEQEGNSIHGNYIGNTGLQDKMYRDSLPEINGGFAFSALIPLIPAAIDLVKNIFSSRKNEGSGIYGADNQLLQFLEEDKPVYKEIMYKDEHGNLIKKELIQLTKLGENMLLDQDFMNELAQLNGVPRQELIEISKKIIPQIKYPARLLSALSKLSNKDKQFNIDVNRDPSKYSHLGTQVLDSDFPILNRGRHPKDIYHKKFSRYPDNYIEDYN